jgi:hypothetical protein
VYTGAPAHGKCGSRNLNQIPEEDSDDAVRDRAKQVKRVHDLQTPPMCKTSALTVANALADEPRGPMDTSDPKDVSDEAAPSERVERSETLFGYSRRSEEPTDAEGVDVDVSALE